MSQISFNISDIVSAKVQYHASLSSGLNLLWTIFGVLTVCTFHLLRAAYTHEVLPLPWLIGLSKWTV